MPYAPCDIELPLSYSQVATYGVQNSNTKLNAGHLHPSPVRWHFGATDVCKWPLGW